MARISRDRKRPSRGPCRSLGEQFLLHSFRDPHPIVLANYGADSVLIIHTESDRGRRLPVIHGVIHQVAEHLDYQRIGEHLDPGRNFVHDSDGIGRSTVAVNIVRTEQDEWSTIADGA